MARGTGLPLLRSIRQKVPVAVKYSLIAALCVPGGGSSAHAEQWRSRTKPTSAAIATAGSPSAVTRSFPGNTPTTPPASSAEHGGRSDAASPKSVPMDAVPLNAVVVRRGPSPAELQEPASAARIQQTAAQDEGSRSASPRLMAIPTAQQPVDPMLDVDSAPDVLPPHDLPSSVYTWNDSYQSRIQNVVPRPAGSCSEEEQNCDIAVWWHDNSVEHQERNRHLVHAVVQPQRVRTGVKEFVADHTLPPQIEPDQPLYDSQPRYVELGPIRPVAAQTSVRDSSHLARLTRDITQIQPTLSYALEGIREDQLPDDFFEKMDNGTYTVRTSAPTVLQWAPTNLWHHPLYFEDPALERYGHTYHPLIQPFASSGRFATQLVGLPYQMTLHPVHAKEYTLGWYRPGDCAPKKHYQIPFNEEATLMQIAVVAGLILIFP